MRFPTFQLNFAALNQRSRLLAGSGAALLAVMFLPWFRTADEQNPFIPPARDITINAWEAFSAVDFTLALTGLAAIAAVLLAARDNRQEPTAEQLGAIFALSLISAAFVLARIYDPIANTDPRFGTLVALAVLGLLLFTAVDGARFIGGFLTAAWENARSSSQKG